MSAEPDPLYPELENLGAATAFIGDIFEVIEHIPLFGDFSYAEIERLCDYMDCYGAPADAQLLKEGAEGDFLLLILTGLVEVRKIDTDGSCKAIATVGPGNTIGEMSLIDGRERYASCVTVEPTDFAVLRRNALNALLALEPMLGARFLLVLLTEMTRRLRDANERLLPYITAKGI